MLYGKNMKIYMKIYENIIYENIISKKRKIKKNKNKSKKNGRYKLPYKNLQFHGKKIQ